MRLRRLNRLHEDERGQVTAWFIGLALLLFAFLALSFDLGLLHLQRRVAQNSVDPAVLAGAAYLQRCSLAGTGLDPLDVAEDFAERNLGVGSNATSGEDLIRTAMGTFHVENDVGEADWQSVRARVDREQGYVFGQALGLVSANVPAEAEATCGPISEGTICPMWIEGDRDDPPEVDEDGHLVGDTAYGLQIGRVYGMKINNDAEHYGALDSPNGSGGGTNDWRRFVANGCEEDGVDLNVCEGTDPECEVNTKPGDFGNPVLCALEGCSAIGGQGLYTIEKTDADLFEDNHLSCDLHLTVDPDDTTEVIEVRSYSNGIASTSSPIWERDNPANDDPAAIVAAVNEMTDPSTTPAVGGAPCGGLVLDPGDTQGDGVPELLYESVQGRFMYIAMTDGDCPTGGGSGSCDLPVLGILRMYIVCWTNQEEPGGGGNPPEIPAPEWCVEDFGGGPSDTTIYGVFADFTAPNLLGGGGLGTNPLAPFHVVLVR